MDRSSTPSNGRRLAMSDDVWSTQNATSMWKMYRAIRSLLEMDNNVIRSDYKTSMENMNAMYARMDEIESQIENLPELNPDGSYTYEKVTVSELVPKEEGGDIEVTGNINLGSNDIKVNEIFINGAELVP